MEGLDRWSLHIRVIYILWFTTRTESLPRGQRSSNGRNRPKSTLLCINWFIRCLLSQITEFPLSTPSSLASYYSSHKIKIKTIANKTVHGNSCSIAFSGALTRELVQQNHFFKQQGETENTRPHLLPRAQPSHHWQQGDCSFLDS